MSISVWDLTTNGISRKSNLQSSRMIQIYGKRLISVSASIPNEMCILENNEFVTSVKVPLDDGGTHVMVTAVGCGDRHHVGVTSVGNVYSWGDGSHGSLGLGNLTNCNAPRLVRGLGNIHIVGLSVGHDHTLLLSADCRVFSFGNGTHGKLGHGDERSEYQPREVELCDLHTGTVQRLNSELHYPVIRVAAGTNHSAMITGSGYLLTFGSNDSGQLDGDQESKCVPTLVDSLAFQGYHVSDVACGATHTLCVTNSKKAFVLGKLTLQNDESSQHVRLVDMFPLDLEDLEISTVHPSAILLGSRSRDRKLEHLADSLHLTKISFSTLMHCSDQIASMYKVEDGPATFNAGTSVPDAIQFGSNQCSYHNRFAQTPLSSHLIRGAPESLSPCTQCLLEQIAALGTRLKQESTLLLTERRNLDRERADAAAFRQLCMEQDAANSKVFQFREEVKMITLKDGDEAGAFKMAQEIIEELSARIIQLETANRELESENQELLRTVEEQERQQMQHTSLSPSGRSRPPSFVQDVEVPWWKITSSPLWKK